MNQMDSEKHPSLDILATLSNQLEQKRIIVAMTGSVAITKIVDLCRLLLRHGAEVIPVMSSAACKLVSPELVHWACGRKPITELTGLVEHVAYAGNTQTKADLMIVAPATANTLSKIACGIDDTPVTTFATTALGEGIPMIVVPAMHESMVHHPALKKNIDTLKQFGVEILFGNTSEGKLKIADNETIITTTIRTLTPQSPLTGKNVIVTLGRTVEYLDPIRVVTNNSSGKMGVAIAEACYKAGANVTAVCGKIAVEIPSYIRKIEVDTAQAMWNEVDTLLGEQNDSFVFASAAVGDWKPVQMAQDKVSTDAGSITLKLEPTVKIIDQIKNKYPAVKLMAFRALWNKSDIEMIENGKKRLEKADADWIAINDCSKPGCGFETETNEMILLSKKTAPVKIEHAKKRECARTIVQTIIRELLS